MDIPKIQLRSGKIILHNIELKKEFLFGLGSWWSQ